MKGTLPRSRTKKILIKSLNTGKSDDIFNIKAEHFVHANDAVAPVLSTLFNAMKEMGRVPDCMKLGVLTPVFKRKGSKLDAKKLQRENNYTDNSQNPRISLKRENKKGKRKVQGVPQSQTAALPRPQEEEETDKSKQAQIEQTYEKH